MLVQLFIVGALTAGAIYYRSTMDYRNVKPYIKKWKTLMQSMDIQNKQGETYEPFKIEVLDNGIIYFITIPPGLTIDKLNKIQNEINTYFKGVSTIKKIKFADYCIIKIITKDVSDYEFVPVKCKPSEIYVGKTLDLENYTIDLTKSAAHILIGAPSGKGKSFLLASILTNLIYNSCNNIELYLLQIIKGDIASFENCKPVKFTAYSLEEVAWGLTKAVEIISRRDKYFRSLGINSLKNYNKHYPKSKFKIIYLVTEEISFFMESSTDNEIEKELKAKCLDALKTITKAGRSTGVHLITVTQRSTIDNIPSTMKSMMIRISLGQISSVDSRNIIESDDAIYLDEKECYVYGDIPGLNIIKIPTIDEDFKILNKYVPEIRIPSKNNKLDNNYQNTDNKKTIINKVPVTLESNLQFKGPEFKFVDLNVNENIDKKIKNRKGIYREDA